MPFPAAVAQVAADVRNWGRWGDDDERGTLNLVTPESVRRGVAAVRDGEPLSLALPMSPRRRIQPPRAWMRPDPLRTMTRINGPIRAGGGVPCTSDDVVTMGLQASTHWDALAHVSHDGMLYNGRPADSVGAGGAAHGGIHAVGPLVTRGVLLDVAGALGVERLAPGHPVGPDELDAAEARARLEVQPGDIVVVRTGYVQLVRQGDPDTVAYGGAASPGLTVATARWFRQRDVAAVATDNYSFEVIPWEHEDAPLAVHALHLVEMGMLQGQNWDLEALAAACAADGRYDFLLQASPLPFVAATGAPVHPVALR